MRYCPFMSKKSSSRLKISLAWYFSSDSFPCIFIFNQDSAFCSICINHCPFPFWAQLWMINKTHSSLWTCNTSYFSSDLFCTFSILKGWHGTSQHNTISTLTLLLFQCPCFFGTRHWWINMMKEEVGCIRECKDHSMEEQCRGRQNILKLVLGTSF